jgi:elongation factor 2
MVNFTVEQVRAMMDRPQQIRNMSVIAHVDHGKSTLSDSLIAAAAIIRADSAGDARHLDGMKEEIERGITIKSTAISMMYNVRPELIKDLKDDERDFLVNLIDSPGHVDFSSEVTAALRVTDGALVVVDCVEGACVQTETVLRQALTERVRPVVFVNKVDRIILELQLDPEEAYQAFARVLQNINTTIATYSDPAMGDLQASPERGTAAFGSGLQAWAFSVPTFAKMYASKFGVDENKMCERLWGDNFYDATAKKWQTSDTADDGTTRLQRAFCQFCLQPLYHIFDAVMTSKTDKLSKMLKSLNITLAAPELDQAPKKVLKAVMMKFLPAADALLQMIVTHLPSPKEAQQYRAELLYSGEPNDKYFTAIKNCDRDGPIVMYISKMVPTSEKGRFFAFGRVFAGRVSQGGKVRIMGNNYVPGTSVDVYDDKPVQRVVVMMGRYEEAVEDVPCGNVCGLVGVDKFVRKTATLTDAGATDAFPLKDMKYSVAPVVRVAVEAQNAADLPKLIESLKALERFDPLVVCETSESGEHIVAGAGELHLEICINALRDTYMHPAGIRVSDPVVTFRETVTATSSQQCMSKSANKHNRLYCVGSALAEELQTEMENSESACASSGDPKERSKMLVEKFEWDATDAKRIWCYGPDGRGANVLVDATRAVQGMSEVKDAFVTAWQWVTKEGVLCDESMRGVRVDIQDVTMHSDKAHRGGGQLIPAARRVCLAAQLTAQPRLVEPVFLVEVQTERSVVGGVYGVLARRRGMILGEEQREGTPICTVRAHVPVAESFGLTSDLRAATSGRAFPQCVFDHWQVYPGDPLEAGSQANKIVEGIRTRKGLKPQVPDLDQFHDKL